jgi:hypothetical protein
MDLSAALAGDLAVLTEAIDDPDVDWEAQLQALAGDLRRAVASYLGMRVTIVIGDREVSFAAGRFDTSTEIVASLLLPLATVATSEAQGMLVFYAGVPGAFVDLAADLSFALGIDPSALILDSEIPPPTQGSAATEPAAHSVINQAVGVFITRGHTPESADAELRRAADLDGGSPWHAAEAILLSVLGAGETSWPG